MSSPVMPDPARTARRAIGVICSFGVPFDAATAIAIDLLASLGQRLADEGTGDLQWIYDVAKAIGEAREWAHKPSVRPSGEPPEALISAMDSLGYTWSVELGKFTTDN